MVLKNGERERILEFNKPIGEKKRANFEREFGGDTKNC
jgi:hypothetical protein